MVFGPSLINPHTGGDLTAFTVEREGDKTRSTVDLLICGNGQYGGLGNNTYTTVQGDPLRVKSLSGLLQCGGLVFYLKFGFEGDFISQIMIASRPLSQSNLKRYPSLPLDISS